MPSRQVSQGATTTANRYLEKKILDSLLLLQCRPVRFHKERPQRPTVTWRRRSWTPYCCCNAVPSGFTRSDHNGQPLPGEEDPGLPTAVAMPSRQVSQGATTTANRYLE